ncbi:MAG: OmpA family protein [Myxococcota bacterium]
MPLRTLVTLALTLLLGTPTLAGDSATGVTVPIEGLFPSNKDSMRSENVERLRTILEELRAAPTRRAELSVHTDSMGSGAYNMTLSQRRADAIVAYLIAQGIDSDRLTAKGYGEERPVTDNGTVEGRASNRRVSLTWSDAAPERDKGAATGGSAAKEAPERAAAVIPHTPTWVDYVNFWNGDFTSRYLDKGPNGFERTMKWVVPIELTAEFSAVFRGPKADAATVQVRFEGHDWKVAPSGESQVWPQGTHELKITSKSRKTTYGLGLLADHRGPSAPTETSDLCTVLDYLTYQVSAGMPDMPMPSRGFGYARGSIAGIDVRFNSKDDLNITLLAGEEVTQDALDEMYEGAANLFAGCLGERVESKVLDWAYYESDRDEPLKTHMGIPSTAYNRARKVVMTARRSNFEVIVSQNRRAPSPYDKDKGEVDVHSVELRVHDAPLVFRMD